MLRADRIPCLSRMGVLPATQSAGSPALEAEICQELDYAPSRWQR
jgi:hypothetical protein